MKAPKKLVIKISMDNAAFEADPGAEVNRILSDLASMAGLNGLYGPVKFNAFDSNGNKVGDLIAK